MGVVVGVYTFMYRRRYIYIHIPTLPPSFSLSPFPSLSLSLSEVGEPEQLDLDTCALPYGIAGIESLDSHDDLQSPDPPEKVSLSRSLALA